MNNNKTEKEYKDRQVKFGRTHQATAGPWLQGAYSEGAIKVKRYGKVAENFLKVRESLNVLEIAAGIGDFVCYCSKVFPQHKYSANDLSEILLRDNIKAVAEYFNLSTLPALSYGPVESLDFPDDSFDLIFIKAAVHHFEDPTLGLTEIRRVLKPGGKLVCLEEPVCLDIPIYRTWKKNNFAVEERAQGLNEHVYTVAEYYSFGRAFSKREMYLDQILVEEFDFQQSKRKGIKRALGTFVRGHKSLFTNFMLWHFPAAVFVFTK